MTYGSWRNTSVVDCCGLPILRSNIVGVNLPLSSLAGITEFQIRSRCKDLLTGSNIAINVKPLMQRRLRE
ncbi:MAG: hypothetical protein M3Y53_04560 [Thermoproteota archaeon]|nr:hypothetical protein [Thermoproteota archaeon]